MTVTEILRSPYSVCIYFSINMYVNDILFSVCVSVRECVHIGVCVFVRCSLSNDFLLPFPPDLAHHPPQWVPIPPSQSLSPSQMFPGPSAVGYHPYYVRQPQGVCGVVCK